ncbi:hypothetical protein [Brevibacillus agri]|uniref:hypothetical protein n=1 Tax=Brevibacillus agri TaxID=51101 RepID=UPI0004726DBD|nr:hypothetical protein [Brevibacillus agri]
MFNEYQHRDLSKRFQLKLCRNNETPLSSWEISNFVNQLTSFYFKTELINSISLAINNNIAPENIFILTESFGLNKTYDKLDVLSIPDELLQLYYIGYPISLVPNKEILSINILFKIFRELNEVLYNTKPRLKLSSDVLTDAFVMIDNGIEAVINYISQQALLVISDSQTRSDKDKNNLDEKLNKITNVIKKHLRTFEKYRADEVQIELIKEHLFQSSVDINEIKDYELILSKYFNTFYYYFSKVSRPVIGIYNKTEKQVQIIGKSQINKKKRDELFFDTKSISHNSPLSAFFEAGLGLGQLAIERERLKLEKEKHEWERKKFEIELQTMQQEQQIKELEKIDKQIELYSRMEEFLSKQGQNQINNIQNPYLRQNMMESRQKIFLGYHRLIEKNGLTVVPEDTKIIDVKI